jgi:uncharacterized membrane protein YgcG
MNKKTSLILTALCGILLLVYACRRDINHVINQDSVSGQFIETAKIYHSTRANQTYTVNGRQYKLRPIWKDSWKVNANGKVLLAVPTREVKFNNKNIEVRRVFLFEQTSGEITSARIVEFVGDKYDVTANLDYLIANIGKKQIPGFNGGIFQYSVNYLKNGNWIYENGSRTKKQGGFNIVSIRKGVLRMSAKDVSIPQLNGSALQANSLNTNSIPCTGCPSAPSPNCDHVYYYYVTKNSAGQITNEYIVYGGTVNCTEGASSSAASSSSSSEGESTYGGSVNDGTGGTGGSNGSGGNGGPITNNVSDPCLYDMTESIIGKNVQSKINSLIQNMFNGTSTPGLSFISSTEMPGNKPAKSTIVRNQATHQLLSVTITLNTNMLANASKEYIAASILHEVMHAYLNGLGPTNESWSHEEMAEIYFEDVHSALQNMFQNTMSQEDAEALTWGGLEETLGYEYDIPQDRKDNLAMINSQYLVKEKGTGCSN